MRMKTPESASFPVSLKTTRSLACPIFSRVYQSIPIPPSVLIMPSFTPKEPGPTCCQPSRFFPLKRVLGVSFALTEIESATSTRRMAIQQILPIRVTVLHQYHGTLRRSNPAEEYIQL